MWVVAMVVRTANELGFDVEMRALEEDGRTEVGRGRFGSLEMRRKPNLYKGSER